MSKPGYTVIERTAAQMAAVFYDAARNTGMKSKYKNARLYAMANFETFIPKAIEILTDMLSRDDVNIHMKDEISNALIERANDAGAHAVAQQSLHQKIDLSKMPDFKPDAGEGVIKPPVINTIDPKPTGLKNIKKGLLYG